MHPGRALFFNSRFSPVRARCAINSSRAREPAAESGAAHQSVPALDGLRAISICLVLAAHLLPLGPKSLDLNTTSGLMAMGLFFTLSGYLIASTLSYATVSEFIVKRIARILPLAYLYILLVFVLYGLSTDALLAHVTFFVNYRLDQVLPVTEHLWSLCVEVHFYLLVTLLVLVGGRSALMLVWPLCIAMTAVRLMQGAQISIMTHLRIDEILAGACVATLPIYRFRIAALPVLVWSFAIAAWAVTSHPESGWPLYLRPYTAALLLWTTLAQPPNFVTNVLSSRILRYIAATSYALYIIHPLTAHGWWNDGSLWQRYVIKRPLGLLITLIAAHLSTFYWERAWIGAARRYVRSMRARTLKSVEQPQVS